jgi:hypothetical protein
MGKGYEIQNLVPNEFLYGRFTDISRKELAKHNLYLVGEQGSDGTRVVFSCEHCNEPSVSIKHREFTAQLSDYQLFKDSVAPCS